MHIFIESFIPLLEDQHHIILLHLYLFITNALSLPLVTQAPSCVGPETAALVKEMEDGDILLCENARFDVGK